MKVKALLFVMVLAISPSSFAVNLWSGNDLFPFFLSYESVISGRASEADMSNMTAYLGYIRGTSEVWDTMSVSTRKMCIDKSVTLQQLASVVGNYMRQNPNKLNQAAMVLVAMSLSEAFPCPRP